MHRSCSVKRPPKAGRNRNSCASLGPKGETRNLEQELLAAWLNFGAGVFDLGSVVKEQREILNHINNHGPE